MIRPPAESTRKDQFLFGQAICTQTNETLNLKMIYGIILSALSFAIVMIYRHTMMYIKSMDKINDKLIDMKMVTLADYSIRGIVHD